MKTKTKKEADKPKRLLLSELCEKHGIPMWPKPYRSAMVHISGTTDYNELTWLIARPVLRGLHDEGCIEHKPVTFVGGGIFWNATPKGLKMRDGILRVEHERSEQKRLGHGVVPA